MERLTIEYDGMFAPKKLCTVDRLGGADDCDSCEEHCNDCNGECHSCAVQECFTKLAEYESTGLTPEEIQTLKTRFEIYKNICGTKSPEEIEDMYKELSSYRGSEEQGLLIKLPCKVGDTVYWINNYHGDTESKKITQVQVQTYTFWLSCGLCVMIANLTEDIPCIDKEITEFGKTLFLTREAAEEVLRLETAKAVFGREARDNE